MERAKVDEFKKEINSQLHILFESFWNLQGTNNFCKQKKLLFSVSQNTKEKSVEWYIQI